MDRSPAAIAFDLIVEAVDRAQATDSLAPVCVITPSRASAVDARRVIARTAHGGRGALGVTARTLPDLVADLVARSPRGAGRRPLTPAARQAAIRAALIAEPGPFAEVADQPVTVRALARASEQLDGTDDALFDAAPGLAGEVVRIHRAAMQALIGGWLVPAEALTIACDALADPTVRRRLGRIILVGHNDMAPHADRRMAESLRALDDVVEVPLAATGDDVVPYRLVSASDADEEARAVARLVVELLRNRVQGHRIGVFWGSGEPYRTLLHAHLAEAGVTVSGPGARTLADTPLGRSLLRLLALDPDDLDPLAVLNVLADGVLRWSEKPLPSSAEAERIMARDRIDEPVDPERGVFFGNTEPDSDRADGTARGTLDEQQQKRLKRQTLWDEYLAAIAASIREVAACANWAEVTDALHMLVETHFAVPIAVEPPELLLAREQLVRTIGELAALDEIAGARPTLAAVRSTLETQFVESRARHGQQGAGVALGSFAAGVARDLDHVFVVGLAEGIAPARGRDDALLPDTVRQQWGLPTMRERASVARQRFIETLASARTSLTIIVPRGDLRSGGEREASRWLTGVPDAHETLLVRAHHDALLTGAPASSTVPPTEAEWRIRAERTDGDWRAAPAVELLDRARAMRDDRRRGRFTRFTGNLVDVSDLIPYTDAPIAATELEEWVASPLFFFVRRILGVRALDLQVDDFEPSLLELGNIQHEALESFTKAALAGGPSTATLALLLEQSKKAFDGHRRTTWIPHLETRDRRRVAGQLEAWWRREVATGAWSPVSAEQPFGLDDPESHDPVEFELDGGFTISFRGKVDRIDRTPEGVRVIDYKGWRPKKLTITADDPTAGGQKFQLAVYGLFAARIADADGATGTVRTEYDYLRSPEDPVLGFTMTDASVEVLRSDTTAVIRAIRAGVFPARPAGGSLERFTTLSGEADLERLWSLLRETPELAAYGRFFLDAEEAAE
ncbi:PD-(D/E)XK nuclease family protein [Microcella sp.]|uniref:PD-(D/E)XK nuclease family protein n=1 Tax=Microcella sp. TaxID=1913979 RepID=UPI003F70713C